MNVIPLDNRLVIKPDDAESKSAGGIIIPDTAQKIPQRGTVVAAGLGLLATTGERVKMKVGIGDNVLYGKYSGLNINIDGVPHRVVRENELLAVYN